MNNLEELKVRIERIISDVKDLFDLFKTEIDDPQKAVSFSQVKAVEDSIERMKRQGLPIPEELNQLKLKLFSTYENHKEILSLHDNFLNSLNGLLRSEKLQKFVKMDTGKTEIPSHRKSPNYEKPLGSKGNSNLEDYLIPVIALMWNGHDHTEAFRQVSERLDVRYNTVSAQCTRSLGLTTEDFINQVKSKKIVDLIEKKFPAQRDLIKSRLGQEK
jgi:hypothetical protein